MNNFIKYILFALSLNISPVINGQNIPEQIEYKYYFTVMDYVSLPLTERVRYAKKNIPNVNVFVAFVFINDLETLTKIELDKNCYDMTGDRIVVMNKRMYKKFFKRINHVSVPVTTNEDFIDYDSSLHYPEFYLFMFSYFSNNPINRKVYYEKYKDVLPEKVIDLIEIDLEQLNQ